MFQVTLYRHNGEQVLSHKTSEVDAEKAAMEVYRQYFGDVNRCLEIKLERTSDAPITYHRVGRKSFVTIVPV